MFYIYDTETTIGVTDTQDCIAPEANNLITFNSKGNALFCAIARTCKQDKILDSDCFTAQEVFDATSQFITDNPEFKK